jgi:V/A-type H+-transporting ATPase subunit F
VTSTSESARQSAETAQRVAVVGDPTSVSGFRPLGFAVYALDRPEEARTLWHELSGGFYAAVFVTEPVYEAIEDLAEEVFDRATPAVTVIPGAGSSMDLGRQKMLRAVERALGTTSLIKEKEE